MYRKFSLALISLVALAAPVIYTYRTEFSPPAPLPVEEKKPGHEISMAVPDVEFSTLDGKPFALSQLKGRVILLNFWASWCPPCVEEFPAMLRLARKMEGKLALVAVSNDANVADVEKFLKTLPSEFSSLSKQDIFVLIDRNGAVTSERFAVLRYPESFVIDSSYKISRKLVGAVDWMQQDLVSYFSSLTP